MKKNYKSYLLCFLLSICFVIQGCQKDEAAINKPDLDISQSTSQSAQQAEATFQFIDTGNSDAILIGNNGEYMMIDGGDNDDEELLKNYLENKGIKKLKYVVLTHPDADHCGGLDRVIESVAVEQVFIGNGDAQTATYRDFVQAAIDKGLKPSVPLPDKVFKLGTAEIRFYNQETVSRDVNDNSLVTLYTEGNFKALFTGDASRRIEESLPLKEIGRVNLLKVGHHGSKTSSSPAFIQAVSPEYAVICCGLGNKFGHPNQETLDTLMQHHVQVYRTDLNGTITMDKKGDQLSVQCDKKENAFNKEGTSKDQSASQQTTVMDQSTDDTLKTQKSDEKLETVYVTQTGKKYHREGCSHLNKSKIPMTKEEAEKEGYTPCSSCYS